jgi:beta-N-acetylhexosaminidase
MSRTSRDGSLAALAEAVLLPPFPGLAAPGWLLRALERGLAGVTLFSPNIESPGQLRRLTAALRAAVDEPVIAIDEEGGDVTRLAHLTGSPYPGNAALGAIDDVELTRGVYRALGADLAAAGINTDLAPSVDVNTTAGNPVIGTRAFGSATELVSRHGVAAVAGLQSVGVAACAKHFPGHGSTRDDTHDVVATVEGGDTALRQRDLPPFAAVIATGAAAVMPGHLRVPGLTGSFPASQSAAALGRLLRGELGFTGLIISDALEMRAVSSGDGIGSAAVRATAAGVDLLCLGRDLDEDDYLAVRDAIVTAVAEGTLPEGRLADAAERVARFRAWLADRTLPAAGGAASPDGHGVGLAAARRAVGVRGALAAVTNPVVIELTPPRNVAAGSVPWGLSPWVPAGSLVRLPAGNGAGPADVAVAAVREAGNRPLITVVRDAHRNPDAQALIRQLLGLRPDMVVVEMGLPVWQPPARTYLFTYGASRTSGQAAAELLGLAGPDGE